VKLKLRVSLKLTLDGHKKCQRTISELSLRCKCFQCGKPWSSISLDEMFSPCILNPPAAADWSRTIIVPYRNAIPVAIEKSYRGWKFTHSKHFNLRRIFIHMFFFRKFSAMLYGECTHFYGIIYSCMLVFEIRDLKFLRRWRFTSRSFVLWLRFQAEDGGSKALRKAGILSHRYTASQLTRPWRIFGNYTYIVLKSYKNVVIGTSKSTSPGRRV